MNNPHEHIRELVSLSLLALREQPESIYADPDTFHFFTSVPKCPQKLPSIPQHMAPLPLVKPRLLPTEKEEIPEPIVMNDQPLAQDVTTRRLEKLLPHTFVGTPLTLAETRKAVLSQQSIALAEKPLYPNVAHADAKWSIFSLVNSSEATDFVNSVAKAICERLHTKVSQFSCFSQTFPVDIQLSASDSAVLIIFVEHHLETTLVKQLESVRHFQKKQSSSEPPFLVAGELLSLPIRVFIIHPTTATDVSCKQLLWTRLKSFA